MTFQTNFASNWSGASGQQIGFATGYPETRPWGFVTDPIHGEAVDPNQPDGPPTASTNGEVPVSIQGQEPYVPAYPGNDGWLLDDIPFPDRNAPTGTAGHDMPYEGHNRRAGTGRDHRYDVYQDSQPIGHGRDFYGKNITTGDLRPWESSSTPNPNANAFPAQAREDAGGPAQYMSHDAPQGSGHAGGWPEPWAVQGLASDLRPVALPTEKIPMRRLAEDDRPVYNYLAVPARNIQPVVGGTPWTPTYPSNVPLYNQHLFQPQVARTPEDPWVSPESASPDTSNPADADVLGGLL